MPKIHFGTKVQVMCISSKEIKNRFDVNICSEILNVTMLSCVFT